MKGSLFYRDNYWTKVRSGKFLMTTVCTADHRQQGTLWADGVGQGHQPSVKVQPGQGEPGADKTKTPRATTDNTQPLTARDRRR